ncbi:MAG: chalcone isomerase family protein [Rhizobacter sp.]|nr:chalcone isomerase family protein [Rhizobacter sp.]
MCAALARPLAAFVTSLVLTLGAAQAQNTSTKFEASTVVAGTPLVLNGAGTRHRTVFKVYDMALYTTKKVSKVDDLLALPGPKRLNFVALRELPSTELGRLFLKGMGENSSKDLMTKHALASTRLIEVFSGKAKLMPGDSFAMEFVPGKGTQFFITGKAQGEPVGDAEFFSMIMKIWVGASPADNLLKEALLGG